MTAITASVTTTARTSAVSRSAVAPAPSARWFCCPFGSAAFIDQFGSFAAPERGGRPARELYRNGEAANRRNVSANRGGLFVRLRQIGHCIVRQPLPVSFAALRRLDNALGHDFPRHPLVARRCQRTARLLDRRPCAFKGRRQDIDDLGFEGRFGQQWDYGHDCTPQ